MKLWALSYICRDRAKLNPGLSLNPGHSSLIPLSPPRARSNVTITSDRLSWDGEVQTVPSLDAPGFCFIESKGRNNFPDASAFTHLSLRVRATIPYSGFKADFATALHPNSQFTSFKADFPSDFNSTSCNGDWVDVLIPFSSFTWDWSSYTGEPLHTCEEDPKYCPSVRDLQTITVLEVWAEGVAGKFHMEVQSIGAANL